MKAFVFAIILLLTIHTESRAQYSQLLHRPHSEQKEILSDLYYSASFRGMTLAALTDTLAGMRELGIKENDPNLRLEADLLEAFFQVHNKTVGIDVLIQIQQESEAKGFLYIASRAANAIASYYWEKMEFEKSIRWHLMLDELMIEMSIDEFPKKAIFLQEIGNDFYFYGDYASLSHTRNTISPTVSIALQAGKSKAETSS